MGVYRYQESSHKPAVHADHIPQGLKPTQFAAFRGTAEQAAEKLKISGELGKNVPPWLKPAWNMLALCGG
jgi:hypothetical protein